MLAHIAGIPVEETALGLAPMALAAAAVASVHLRRLAAQRRPTWLRRSGPRAATGRQA